jgi:ubiquinone/menaquinone biosynthesis C-methylase UbiE
LSSAFEQVSIDQVARFWDRRPCNIRHSPAPVGSRRYFDEVEARKYRVEPHIPGFADFPRWRGKRVLEIGCGIGTDTVNFARAGATVTAVDLSAESLRIARQRAEVMGVADRIQFHRADAESLDSVLPVESYDLVYAFGVLHHTPRPDRALRQLRRYLAPGGTLKAMLYHRRSWKVLSIAARHGRLRDLDRLVARHSEAQTGCPVTHLYSRRQAQALLRATGFRVTDAAVQHIFPYRVSDYVRYEHVRAWPWRALPGPVFRWLERRIGWHLCLTAEPTPQEAAGC